MSTTSTIRIDGVCLYSHWDGYPSGMSVKLENMIGHLLNENDHEQFNPVSCAFIAGNISNIQFIPSMDDIYTSYQYYINFISNKITCYVDDVHDDIYHKESEMGIFEFMAIHGDSLMGRIYWDEVAHKLYNDQTFKLTIQHLVSQIQMFDDKNPNKHVSFEKLLNFYSSLRVCDKQGEYSKDEVLSLVKLTTREQGLVIPDTLLSPLQNPHIGSLQKSCQSPSVSTSPTRKR